MLEKVLFYESFIKFYFNYALTAWKKISNIKCSTVFLLLNIKQCLEIWIRWPRFWLSGSGSEKICRSTDPDPMGKISNRQNIQCAKYLSKTAKKTLFYSSLKMQYIKLVNKGVDFWPNSICMIPKTLQPDGVNLFIPNIWSNRTKSLKFIRHGN